MEIKNKKYLSSPGTVDGNRKLTRPGGLKKFLYQTLSFICLRAPFPQPSNASCTLFLPTLDPTRIYYNPTSIASFAKISLCRGVAGHVFTSNHQSSNVSCNLYMDSSCKGIQISWNNQVANLQKPDN